MSYETIESEHKTWALKSVPTLDAIKVVNGLKSWADISKINYFTLSTEAHYILSNKSRIFPSRSSFLSSTVKFKRHEVQSDSQTKVEVFPEHVTSLMNTDNYWGSFYLFPELFADEYSPTVRVRTLKAVPDITDGVLTKDVVAARLGYLHHNPLLKEYVYIKLNISSMQLTNIDILQSYKYLVYLDLSDNLMRELTALSHLPYLQFLSVSTNRLTTVLEYDTPQWFLTQVYYRNNSVTEIRNLCEFWSITILDLSHNDITSINGLETLKYLRSLDLSFNHIEKLENLDNLRLMWLDLAYNNITEFDHGPNTGLCTLLHLEYLNIDENEISSLKIFSGCTRLHEIRARNNKFSSILELAVYMKELRRLSTLDFRGNPVCKVAGYKDVIFHTFPNILFLDDAKLDPAEVRKSKMDAEPNIDSYAIRRLLRMLYVEQLSRATVPRFIPAADTTEVPIVVLVGHGGIGKGTLARRLAQEYPKHIEQGLLHTTSEVQKSGTHHQVTQEKFDEMLRAGELLTYSEINGESYGLSREEAFINAGKVKLVCMDLIGALVLRHRGRRPYFILATFRNQAEMDRRQNEKNKSCLAKKLQRSADTRHDTSTLQVLVSGRIIMRGIINEILLALPDEDGISEFQMSSECSLLNDIESQQAADNYLKELKMLTLIHAKSISSQNYSNYNYEDDDFTNLTSKPELLSTHMKSVDFDNCPSVGLSDRDILQEKPQDIFAKAKSCTAYNMVSEQSEESISQLSLLYKDNYSELLELLGYYKKSSSDIIISPSIRDEYEDIHRSCPGFFKDTVTMDNPDEAFLKLKKNIKDIVNSQNTLKPMFDIDFSDIEDYPNYNERLATIQEKIAKHRFF